MKKISFFHSALAAIALTVAFTSCSKDDENNDSTPPTPVTPYHYDLTVSVGNHGGMGQDKQGHLTMSVASLSNPQTTITFVGSGSEITDYTMEAIYKGKYMYQVPVSADRFSKLQFKNNKMQVIQEQSSRRTPTVLVTTPTLGLTTTRWSSWLPMVTTTRLSGLS